MTELLFHGMLPGSHEGPGGPECRCGAAWDRWNERCGRHSCESCEDCIHDGNKCCGCYDGACCQEKSQLDSVHDRPLSPGPPRMNVHEVIATSNVPGPYPPDIVRKAVA